MPFGDVLQTFAQVGVFLQLFVEVGEAVEALEEG
jgi:hypothetical protein